MPAENHGKNTSNRDADGTLGTFGNVILNPRPPEGGNPLPHPVGSNCDISANGSITLSNGDSLSEVFCRVNNHMNWTTASFSPAGNNAWAWTASGVKLANLAGTALNTFELQFKYIPNGTTTAIAENATRTFIGTGGYSACYYYHVANRAATAIVQALPRSYTLQSTSRGGEDRDAVLRRFRGLSERGSVDLEYDAAASTLDSATWSSEDDDWSWQLTVERSAAGTIATLVYRAFEEKYSAAPEIFMASEWNFFSTNTLSIASLSQRSEDDREEIPVFQVAPTQAALPQDDENPA